MRTTFPSTGALHFSTRGEYGVRLMVELARHHGDGPVSLSEMADHEDLPRPYLEQLVVSLREAGLVTSTRGARGGYQLVRDPAVIRMSEVIEARIYSGIHFRTADETGARVGRHVAWYVALQALLRWKGHD